MVQIRLREGRLKNFGKELSFSTDTRLAKELFSPEFARGRF